MSESSRVSGGAGAGGLFWRRLRRHRLAVVSLVTVAGISVLCLAAPIIAPFDFDAIDLAAGAGRTAP